MTAESALSECVGAISLIEVAGRSLDLQEIAPAERDVLRRALAALWSVHDWIYEFGPAEQSADQESKP